MRLCRFELMEPRRLLAADFLPLQIGAVYLEDASSHDEASSLTMPDGSQAEIADLIEITWQGGAPGTQLTELTIDTDKVGDGLTIGDVFFDTQAGTPGAFDHLGLSILENNGFDVTSLSVDDGGTLLTIQFSGFEAGEKLVLTVDVDEQGFFSSNAVAEGNEFEGSEMSAIFEAPHYYTASGSDIFFDYYDISASGLDLPPDPYVPPSKYMPLESEPGPVYTAAAIFPVPQTPLPISLAGSVFIDLDMDNVHDTDEPGIGGVTVTLYDSSGLSWTKQTESDGSYQFDNLLPETYHVIESQPSGYESVGAIAGTVDNVTRGLVTSVDSLGQIELFGGEQSVDNDFGEIVPSSISGRVHADEDMDFVYDKGEELLAGVTIRLLDSSGNEIATTKTDLAGEYIFSGLLPGSYAVEEVHPQGYLDARDYVGSAGGALQDPDSIIEIPIVSGTTAVRYDFVEVSPARICGYVFVDENGNGVRDPEEPGINGVELILLDADGNPTGKTATSGDIGPDGLYCFGDLWPGEYGVREIHPDGYIDGIDEEGSAGGTAHNPGDLITGAILPPGVHGTDYNFGELLPASIAGRIHADIIRNCEVDPGEPLLAGVTVYLLDAVGNRIGSTETNEKGEYLFKNLVPGTYGVHEMQPEEYLDGPDHVGTAGGQVARNDVVMGAVLGSGVDATGYNFCELVPASISGYVFQDGAPIIILAGAEIPDPATVRDGKLTDDDTPIADVVLQLGDGSGAPILDENGDPIVTATDSNGYYEFNRLEPGLYTVIEVHPTAYLDSIDTPGTVGGIAVNPHQNISDFILSQLAIDPKADAIIRIPINPGDSAGSYNFSEVLVQELPPPPTPRPDPEPEPDPEPVFLSQELPVALFYPPPVTPMMLPLYGGSSGPTGYTWHLSVVNAGRPRRDRSDGEGLASSQDSLFDPVSWTGPDMNQSQWVIANSDGIPAGQYIFGLPGGIPVTGDFDGDGLTEIGVFIDGQWFLDLNGNGRWDKDDFWAKLGTAGDLPVTGDWDGDGKTDIGIYGPAWVGDPKAIAAEPGLPDSENEPTGKFKNLPPDPDEATVGWRTLKRTSQGKLRNDLIDHVFHYGTAGDWPVSGDWNGDGIATIGVFRNGTWSLDVDGNGRWSDGDQSIKLGQEDDLPVVGDWDGDGIDQLGVYRSGKWILDTNNDHVFDAHDKVFELGGSGDRPIVGDFNGDGIDEPAVYHDGKPDANLEVFNPTDPASDTVAGVVREAR